MKKISLALICTSVIFFTLLSIYMLNNSGSLNKPSTMNKLPKKSESVNAVDETLFQIEELTEHDAIKVLSESLKTSGLTYKVIFEKEYNGEPSYEIEAYYDTDCNLIKGKYVVQKISQNIIILDEYENTNSFIESNNEAVLSEHDAITILIDTLKIEGLSYTIMGEEKYNGHDAYSIKAYYDEGDHVTTKGFYLVTKDLHEVYETNILGEGYNKIS